MSTGSSAAAGGARDLAVVLYDLAWLLPRTVGGPASRADPLRGSELEIMRLLARRPGLSVNEVAGELGLQASNVSTAVRSLVAAGVLHRSTDAQDRRIVRLEPTQPALAARERREQSWGAELAGVLGGLPPDEREQLLGAVPVLRALADRLAGREPQHRTGDPSVASVDSPPTPHYVHGEG